MKQLVPIFIFLIFQITTGCQTDISGNSYSVGSVGNVNRAVEATVISKREVHIHGNDAHGTALGATGGAVAGAAAGGDNAITAIGGAIGGAIIGGLAGGAVERNANSQKGIEYVLKTKNGALLTVVQGTDPSIDEGQKVIVLYGVKSRIIPSK